MTALPMEKDDMDLPAGKTCAVCVWFKKCQWLIGVKGHETRCDWSPSRFDEAAQGEES